MDQSGQWLLKLKLGMAVLEEKLQTLMFIFGLALLGKKYIQAYN